MLAGCAGYQVRPLATTHPAHPDAPAAPAPPPSRTLSYTLSDLPARQQVPRVTTSPHVGDGTGSVDDGRARTVVGEGAVVATVPTASQIVVDHGEIEGFMDAMTMGYRVDPPRLLDGLKPGDRVRFRIDVPTRTITAIEPLP